MWNMESLWQVVQLGGSCQCQRQRCASAVCHSYFRMHLHLLAFPNQNFGWVRLGGYCGRRQSELNSIFGETAMT